MSHVIGMMDWVREFKTKYELTAFVETGCCEGRGLKAAVEAGFNHLYSCDINRVYVDISKREVPTASIWHAKSTQWLQEVLPLIPHRCLIWLDAHFPNYHSAGTSDDTLPLIPGDEYPLIGELNIIRECRDGRDVILFDDMRCLVDVGRQHELSPEFHVPLTTADMARAVGEKYLFNNSLVGYAEGVGIFLPKILPTPPSE